MRRRLAYMDRRARSLVGNGIRWAGFLGFDRAFLIFWRDRVGDHHRDILHLIDVGAGVCAETAGDAKVRIDGCSHGFLRVTVSVPSRVNRVQRKNIIVRP